MAKIQSFKDELSKLLSRRVSLIWVDCFDYEFMSESLLFSFQKCFAGGLSSMEDEVQVWDSATGLRGFNSDYLKVIVSEKDLNLSHSIKTFWESKRRILIVKEAWIPESEDRSFYSILQNFFLFNSKADLNERKTIIFISSTSFSSFPSETKSNNAFELKKIFHLMKMPYPDADDISLELDRVQLKPSIRRNNAEKKKLLANLAGMSLFDIRRTLKSIQDECEDGIGVANFDSISKAKKKIAEESQLIQTIEVSPDEAKQVGGVDSLVKYIKERKKIIDNIAVYPQSLPRPKGILLVGPAGMGKSASARCVAAILGVPLLRLDVGSLMGMYVGQSEHNLESAIKVAEAAAPCVLWIDEVEKAFAGAGKEGAGDITVTRMIGHFLTWLQEKKSLVYLVATANDLSKLRDEFLRKGRWDEIFYLSYPDSIGTKDILDKCLKKYHIDFSGNINKVSAAIFEYSFSGAEIDHLVVTAANHKFINSIDKITLLKEERKGMRISEDDLTDVFNEIVKTRASTKEIREMVAKYDNEYRKNGYRHAK